MPIVDILINDIPRTTSISNTDIIVVTNNIDTQPTTNTIEFGVFANAVAHYAGAAAGALTANVTVTGTTIGAVSSGYVFPAGMTFQQFVEAISIYIAPPIPPTYTAPTLSLGSSPSPGNIEVGTTQNIALTGTYTQHDGGAAGAYVLYKNSAQLSTSTSYTDSSVQITETPITYNAHIAYAQGPVKTDTQGNANATGQIQAGTATSGNITFTGSRKAFYGTSTNPVVPTTNAEIRALSSTFNVGEGGNPNFTITVPIGAAAVIFAYPATERDVTSVKYVEYAYNEIKASFDKTLVNVSGANGYSPISYKVYTFIPVEPYSQVVNYQVFI